MLWRTLYRKWPPKGPKKLYAGLNGTYRDLNASRLKENTRTTLKNRWDIAQCLPTCDDKSNHLNQTFCLQKVQKNHNYSPTKLKQTKEDEEDENNVVDQTVSINASKQKHHFT